MNILKFSLIGGLLLLAGCETTSSIPYEVSTGNIMKMRANVELGNTVRVEEFDIANGVDQNPMCRLLGPVKVSPGKTMMQFIKDAFEKELYESGLLDFKSPVVIKGRLEKIEFSSVSPASWDLTLRLQSSNGSTLTVTNNYGFATSFSAYGACKNVADAFGPAVQILLGLAIENPDFPSLFARNDSLTYSSNTDESVNGDTVIPKESEPGTYISGIYVSDITSDQPAFGDNITGSYISTITGNTQALNIKGRNPEVKLTQNGKNIKGTFGDSGGKIWGDIEGDTVKFDWTSSAGNRGKGKWTFNPESKMIVGTWDSSWIGEGDWNLTRVE